MKRIAALIAALIVALALPATAFGTPVSVPVSVAEGVQHQPDIAGPWVVWQDERLGYDDLWIRNIATGDERALTSGADRQSSPAIHGSTVVAENSRALAANSSIFGYDVLTGAETPYELTGLVDRFTPDISGAWVVWADARAGTNGYDIYAYNRLTGEERLICDDIEMQEEPTISGDWIAWRDARKSAGANGDIYAYSLASGETTTVCTDVAIQEAPAVSGDWVVWQDFRADNFDIYAYNLVTRQESEICTAAGDQIQPAIDGEWIVWQDYRDGGTSDVYAYNLVSEEETAVCTADGSQEFPAVSEGYVVWQDFRAGSMSDVYGASLVSQPDLTAVATAAPPTAVPGATISVATTVTNGGAAAAAASTVRFYVSTDAEVTRADTPIGSRAVGAMAPGASSAGAAALRLPPGLEPGSYFIGGLVDADGALVESDETNNGVWVGAVAVTQPANDAFATPFVLAGVRGARVGDLTYTATKEADEPKHAGNAGGASVWYRWKAPSAGRTTIDLAGSKFDTVLAVYRGTGVGALTTVAANDDYGARLQSRLTFSAVKGATYYIAVDGFNGAAGAVNIAWTHNAVLSTPSTPSSVVLKRTFTAAGTLSPRHTSGARAIRLYFYRLENGRWVNRKVVTARVYTSGSVSRYAARLYLPYRGSWRVRAYHYDADHAPSYSSYRSFKVR